MKEWKVCFEGGFWKGHGRRGEKLPFEASFFWGGNLWHIPGVYACGKGLVVDFCVEIPPERVNNWLKKWMPLLEREWEMTEEQRSQAEEENPQNVDFKSAVVPNRKRLQQVMGSGMNWIPPMLLPEGAENPPEARAVLEHYRLDPEKAWVFRRSSYPWATKQKPKIGTLLLKMEAYPKRIPGIHFTDPKVADVLGFVHPVTGEEHTLSVLAYERGRLDPGVFGLAGYEYPTCHTAMTYQLEPDLPGDKFRIQDVLRNEPPRRKKEDAFEPDGTYSIGIIGGADGPVAVTAVPRVGDRKIHTALSALHFEPAETVEWKMEFWEKQVEDVEVELKKQRKKFWSLKKRELGKM